MMVWRMIVGGWIVRIIEMERGGEREIRVRRALG